jgi:hypothetical protein
MGRLRRSRYQQTAAAVVSVALLGGLGFGAWLYTHRAAHSSEAGHQVGDVGPLSPTSTSPPPSSPAPTTPAPATPTPTGPVPGSPVPGAVAVAPDVTNPAAPQVAAFLGRYFDAINTHNYEAYYALESAAQQQGLTPAQFKNGYGSTADSAETLRGVSIGSNGDYVAQVTFTSTQDAAQSATGTQCTNWDISLYLIPNGSAFLIDTPPPSYHAAYAAC